MKLGGLRDRTPTKGLGGGMAERKVGFQGRGWGGGF